MTRDDAILSLVGGLIVFAGWVGIDVINHWHGAIQWHDNTIAAVMYAIGMFSGRRDSARDHKVPQPRSA